MNRFHILSSASLSALALLAAPAQAQEMGKVISSTPIIQQVSVPRKVCTQQQVTVPEQKSGAGAVLGAVAGGAAGNAIGDGGGRAVATLLGIVGGAMLGNKIEGSSGSRVETTEQCTTQNFYENRTVAYNVVYEYAGKQYSVQMPQDPGQWVKLQITPLVNQSAAPAPAANVVGTQAPVTTVIRSEAVAAPVQVVYVTPYYRPLYPSIGFEYTYRHGHGHRGGYDGHWR